LHFQEESRVVLVKASVIVILLLIMYTLGSSFVFMLRDKGTSDRLVRRLAWRIGLSIFLFLLLYLMFALGWIVPSAGPVRFPADG
jgi:small neutral amino acid transporter SnatA (MarC family)